MPRHAAPRVRYAGFVGCRGEGVDTARAGRLTGDALIGFQGLMLQRCLRIVTYFKAIEK